MTSPVTPPAAPVVPPYPPLGSATFNADAYAYGTAMPGVVGGINDLAESAHTNALSSVESATAAASAAASAADVQAVVLGAANFKGLWSALTGALARPATVKDGGRVWLLLADLPDVTAAVPGVSAAWTALDSDFVVSKSGDTMTGNLNVPSINGGQLAGFRNKIINGKMEIAQRGTSFAAIASSSYSLDRWVFGNTSSAVLTASQQTDVPIGNEFQSSLRFAVTTADSSIAAGDVCWVSQRIEGYNARDLIGRTFTLSFWVRSSKTGVHCVALKNSSANRTYLAEYTVNVADTWEQKSIAITGGLITAGTWDWTNGVGLRVDFALACGTTFQAPPGSWQTGDFYTTSSQVNCLDTIGNVFAITGVQLEVGSVATPFEHRPYGMELALCQRYYRVLCTPGVNAQYVIGSGMMLSTTAPKYVIRLDQPMRTTPSFSISSAGHFTVFAGGATSTLNSFVISGQSDASNIALDGVTSAGLTNAAVALIYTNVTTAIAALSAEL